MSLYSAMTARSYWRYCLAMICLLVGALLVAPVVYARAGDLDPSFGNNGVALNPADSSSTAEGIVTLPNGKTIVSTTQYIANLSSFVLVLVKLNADGSLDTGFGTGGSVITDLGVYRSPLPMFTLPDGKLLVVGTTGSSFVNEPRDFLVARYNSNGSLDTTFGSGGKITTDFAGRRDKASAALLLPDGKIVVGGSSTLGSEPSDFAVARYLADGSLDNSFGIAGKLTTNVGSTADDHIQALTLQSDGKLIAAGSSNAKLALIRYAVDGSSDQAFGNAGLVMEADTRMRSARAVSVQADGKILAAVDAVLPPYNPDFALVRYNSNGTLDASFGNVGKVITDFGGVDYAKAMDLQQDGQIILAGVVNDVTIDFIPPTCGIGGDLGLARYDSNGNLDGTFGNGGKVVTPARSSQLAMSVVEGKITLAGTVCNTSTGGLYRLAHARYLNDSGLPQPGWWWNPDESGRGFGIEVSQNTLVMAGYLYDASGRATWYTSAGPITNNTLYQGALQSFGNGQTLSGPYKPYSLTNPNAGNVTMQFSDATHGTLTWPGGTIPIERYVFGAGASGFQPESGWWWNDSESGRGFSLEVQGNKLVIGGYMYDGQGNPVWYISAGNMMSSTLYQGQWEQYANGQTLTGLYKKPDQVNGNVGSITINFTSRSTATLTLPDGRQIALTRYRF